MHITREWLYAHRTDKGAWTAVQIRAIGVVWPPASGWRDEVIGKEISQHAADLFESGKTMLARSTIKNRAKNEIKILRLLGQDAPQELLDVLKPAPQTPPTNPKSIRRAEKKARRREEAKRKLAKLESQRLLISGLSGASHQAADKAIPTKAAKKRDAVSLPARARPGPCKVSKPDNSHLFVSGIDVRSTEFLGTFEWRRLRMQALLKYGRVCMCCGASPQTGAVVNVDHVKPRKLFPELALSLDNLQILCGDCNHGKGNWDQTDWRPEEFDAEQVGHLRLIAKHG